MKIRFKLPVPTKIIGRSSSITNAFVNTIIPIVKPSDDEVRKALSTLGMTEDNMHCSYCGDKVSEWDHLNAIVKDKKPTGFITEINNLVPSCGKCNQSKGNKCWKYWMFGNAKLSPRTRNINNIDQLCLRLEDYEKDFKPHKLLFEEIVDDRLWKKYWKCNDLIREKMRMAQENADEIKEIIMKRL